MVLKHEGKNLMITMWWSQRDLNPCFNPTTTSPFIFKGFDHVLQGRKGHDSNTKACEAHRRRLAPGRYTSQSIRRPRADNRD